MIETERKFLIRMPDIIWMENRPRVKITEILQTYLQSDEGTERVRRSTCRGEVKYTHTLKHRISFMSCHEEENTVSEEEYRRLLQRSDPERTPIQKTRYAFPYLGHTVEIDVYPFWDRQAILEVELSSEEEEMLLPEDISVIREVTEDRRYKNHALALGIPPKEPTAP